MKYLIKSLCFAVISIIGILILSVINALTFLFFLIWHLKKPHEDDYIIAVNNELIKSLFEDVVKPFKKTPSEKAKEILPETPKKVELNNEYSKAGKEYFNNMDLQVFQNKNKGKYCIALTTKGRSDINIVHSYICDTELGKCDLTTNKKECKIFETFEAAENFLDNNVVKIDKNFIIMTI